MTIERKCGPLESIKNGVPPLGALGGERAWVPMTEPRVVQLGPLDDPTLIEGFTGTHGNIIHEVSPVGDDNSLGSRLEQHLLN